MRTYNLSNAILRKCFAVNVSYGRPRWAWQPNQTREWNMTHAGEWAADNPEAPYWAQWVRFENRYYQVLAIKRALTWNCGVTALRMKPAELLADPAVEPYPCTGIEAVGTHWLATVRTRRGRFVVIEHPSFEVTRVLYERSVDPSYR